MDMLKLPFCKYHGTGNDFVLFDGINVNLPLKELLQPDSIKQICDRHFGIGADGILLLLPAEDPLAHSQMRIFNADGSEAEMCGNGIRCAAKALWEARKPHLAGGVQPLTINFQTKAGLRECHLLLGPTGKVKLVRVAMGRPNLDRASLPLIGGDGPFIEEAIHIQDERIELKATAVSMGNPHLVTFIEGPDDLKTLAEKLGPQLERHPRFPQRTNVEFVRQKHDGFELWVWERGCGITLACGTGACATAVAAVITKRCSTVQPISISLPGGILHISIADDLSQVWMEGPAIEVFRGELLWQS